MQIAFLIYEGLTALDIIGPYEVLSQIPGADIRFVAKRSGPIVVDSGAFSIGTEHKLADVPRPDVFVIPGGIAGTFAAAKDPEILDWVREAHAHSRYSTSVCTGSLILGAAGLLKDANATTHWAAKTLLEQTGATYTEERIVVAGKIITAAGVSAGIDMALYLTAELVGPDLAKLAQLSIEYDPAPPFDAGSPAKAGDAIVQRALEEFAKEL
ncbi:MAG: DJ-1/PfpI family protein [Deltaproteobacteria bacterium]|jgi:putative intracellular protease/amidase|nr:DJ-1/PfpI family protein [Deltaproteobacteria bacterium]MBW2543783.1 DJ-1/PfpI family protein [Deltaproteobacteria bacterium]